MTIPIIHCFDHNYVLPAAVAFFTMLEKAQSSGAIYDLHVLGSGLTDEDKAFLHGIVSRFPNARLSFREPPENPMKGVVLPRRGHYSLDLYYKLMLPEIYGDLARACVSDVDVIWEDDVKKVYDALPSDGVTMIVGAWDPGYAACHREGLFPTGKPLIRRYARKWTAGELEKLRMSAGLMVFDLEGLRKAGESEKWVAFARANEQRAILPEQEPINIVSYDKIALLPHSFMADAASADHPNWHKVFDFPVQLHYASREKPWKYPGTPLADRWFAALTRAGLVERWREWYAAWSKPLADFSLSRHLVDAAIPFGRRTYRLTLTKE